MKHRPRPRLRTQLLLKLGVFLLLLSGGAVVNVAVAWGCALWSLPNGNLWIALPNAMTNDINETYGPISWPIASGSGERFESFGKVIDSVTGDYPMSQGLPAEPTTSLEDSRFDTSALIAIRQIRTGVPVLALEQILFVRLNGQDRLSSMRLPIAVPWMGISEGRGLPVMPLWPGFAINTIFYALLLWVLWIAPGRIRRFIRVRRGRCPACAYQIAPGTGPVCSECGHPLDGPYCR